MKLGTLQQIWRYPVKSMGGECVDTAVVTDNGLVGDRCWAVLDSATREIRSAKRWPALMNYRASLKAERDLSTHGYRDDVPDVDIHCPNGLVVGARSPQAEEQLSAQLANPLLLAPLAPPGDRDHYRLAASRTEQSMAEEMQLLPGEAFPDMSGAHDDVLIALAECVTPPGTYVDAYPLHLMTGNSLRFLAKHSGLDVVVERYRPNLLIEPAAQLAELTENHWLDFRVKLGEAIIHIHSRTVRCSMPSREQQWCGLAAETRMARAMVDHCERHLGVNVMVEQPGRIETGDELTVLS